MQLRITNRRSQQRYAELTVDYAPLQQFFLQQWRAKYPNENALPPVIPNDFVARQLDAALREASRSATTAGAGNNAAVAMADVLGSHSAADSASRLEWGPLTEQIDGLLEASLQLVELGAPQATPQYFRCDENVRDLESNLFFTLANSAFQISQQVQSSTPTQRWSLERHCPLFQRCVGVFQRRYQALVSPHVPPQLHSAELTEALFSAYRDAVSAAFPTANAHADTKTSAIIAQLVKHNTQPSHDLRGRRPVSSASTATLSTVTVARHQADRKKPVSGKLERLVPRKGVAAGADAASAPPQETAAQVVVNEVDMLRNERLLPDSEWVMVPPRRCEACARDWSVVHALWRAEWPLGRVNCRACGRVLCTKCVESLAPCSFAKLSDPNAPPEGAMRPVCQKCFRTFKNFKELRFLGHLFVFGGFDFVHLLLSLGVGAGWTTAAELCVDDYRYLLHTLSSRAELVVTPMRCLLQASAPLFFTRVAPGAPQPTVWHPEGLLELLKTIADEGLWEQDAVRELVHMLASSRVRGQGECATAGAGAGAGAGGGGASGHTASSPQLTHYHMWCTRLCPLMRPFFFYMKAIEYISTAPQSCEYARDALLRLADLARGSIDACQQDAQAAGARSHASTPRVVRPASGVVPTSRLPRPSTDEVPAGELELMTVWLLDLLRRPHAANTLTADDAVRKGLPVLVRNCPQLLCWVLCMLQSGAHGAASHGAHTELEAHILAQVTDPNVRTRASQTVQILTRLDRWVRESPSSRFTAQEVCRWFALNYAPVRPEDAGFRRSGTPAETKASLVHLFHQQQRKRSDGSEPPVTADDYLDLRAPLCDPLHPTNTALRSLFLHGLREEKSSLGKQSPIWLCFSTWSREHRELVCALSPPPADDVLEFVDMDSLIAEAMRKSQERDERTASEAKERKENDGSSGDVNGGEAKPSEATSSPPPPPPGPSITEMEHRLRELELLEGAEEVRRSFLYKLEDVGPDNLMCVSFRLLQWLLRDQLVDVDIPSYGVLPLSPCSGLIEKAAGVPLSQIDSLPDYIAHLPGAPDPTVVARNFLTSLKLFLVLNHVFGIGDRHKGNVLISPHGAIFHIDFGYVFHQRPPGEMLRPAVRLDRHILTAAAACRQQLAETESPAICVTPRLGDPPARVPPLQLPSSSSSSSRTFCFSGQGNAAACTKVEDWFCNEVADLLLLVRPHAVLFQHLWLYGVHQSNLLGGSEQALADYFNHLFATTAFVESCRKHFINVMHDSINKWALKDNSRDFTYRLLQFVRM